jgi:hypothetical protein
MNVDNPDDWEESDNEEESPLLTSIADEPQRLPSSKEVTMMCIVDRSGVHSCALVPMSESCHRREATVGHGIIPIDILSYQDGIYIPAP